MSKSKDTFNVSKTNKFSVLDLLDATNTKKGKDSKPSTTTTSSITKSSTEVIVAVDIEQQILTYLSTHDDIPDSWHFALNIKQDHQTVVGAIKGLLPDAYIKEELLTTTYYSLTSEGSEILTNGSPEYQVFKAISDSTTVADIQNQLGDVGKIGLGKCLQNKWVKKEGDLLVKLKDDVVDEVIRLLSLVQSSSSSGDLKEDEDMKNLKKRKLVQQITRKSYRLSKGPSYHPVRVKRIAELTKEMLGNPTEMANGTHWSQLQFKSVNLNSMGATITGGNYHPLLKVRAEFRRILMDMGFQEMPSNKWVESSFWNFDSLFQPQSHPARDAHDTFFLKDPESTVFDKLPSDYYDRVKTIHEVGGYGSIGYGCVFKKEESMKNLLRTHTTAISAQMLYKLANQPGGFTPQKYFSIDRVFRNEAMDATHLCEFHQVEGLVADRNLTLGHLIGLIRLFFQKIGITEIRFKPAYNPYTEPSMEVFGYHPELKKWTELGNSGMFRPEMLRPMGLPEDVRVIAWGLSLERPTMIKYHIDNIRDLFGHKADLLSQRDAPIARF